MFLPHEYTDMSCVCANKMHAYRVCYQPYRHYHRFISFLYFRRFSMKLAHSAVELPALDALLIPYGSIRY